VKRGFSAKPPRHEDRNEKESLMDGIFTDIRLALRGLRKAPGFTLSAVIILALGIGANVTAFSALKVVVLTPPPFPEAERLVSVDLTTSRNDREGISRWAYPYLQRLADWPDRLIEPVAGYRERVATLTGFGPASQLNIEVVSPDYFDVVGRPLTLGRGFVEEEADPSGPYRVAVVSYSFWRTRLGADVAALGREVQLNGVNFQVVGVAPPDFSGFSGGATLWLPLGAYAVLQPGVLQEAGNHLAWVVGRLRPGATLAAADAQMEVVGQAIAEEWPRSDSYGAGVRSFAEVWTNPEARTASRFLALAAGLVLLVACANLTGLLFTRARRRVREGAVRCALGASRWRLIRSYLVESLAVATFGGIAGLGLSVWGIRLLTVAWPSQFLAGNNTGLQVINPDGLALDARVMTFAVVVSLCSALLIGLIPALRLSSFRITDHLKDGAGATKRHGGKSGLDPQTFLVGAQVSLALMLLIGVGLMGSSVKRLLDVDDGFQTQRLLSFEFSSPQAVPRLDPRDETAWRSHITLSAQFDDQLQQRLNALPGIEGIAMSSGGILKHFEIVLGFVIEDVQSQPSDAGAGVVPVSDNYFELLGIPILRGRVFDQADGLSGPPVVVLSQSAAARFFPNQDPIGKRMTTGFALPGRATTEVVGVVGDVIYTGPEEERTPVVYYSLRESRAGSYAVVRTTGDPNEAVPLIRDELFAMDPTVAVSNITTMDRLISRSVGDRRLIFWLLTIFATITVLLAAVGTWGVVAYSVADRQRELGLRIALGAERTGVLRLVLRRSTLTALGGVVIGLAGAWAGSRVLEAMLWNTSARDPRIFLGGGALLFVVVLGASYLPARRATRVDPVEVLRAAE
jgi:predicted permease